MSDTIFTNHPVMELPRAVVIQRTGLWARLTTWFRTLHRERKSPEENG